MTTVYGVTRYGAKLQIAKQLKDINDFPKDYIWLASSYLTGINKFLVYIFVFFFMNFVIVDLRMNLVGNYFIATVQVNTNIFGS